VIIFVTVLVTSPALFHTGGKFCESQRMACSLSIRYAYGHVFVSKKALSADILWLLRVFAVRRNFYL